MQNIKDKCRSCHGPLEILEKRKEFVKVECRHCGDIYTITKEESKQNSVDQISEHGG